MKLLANYYAVLRCALAMGLSTLASCVSYGPALTGSESLFIPISTIDTVATVATGVYGTVAWPLTYDVDNRNDLVGLGAYQTRGLAQAAERQAGWSFAYGGMAYAGRYLLEADRVNSSYRYAGGMLHGAARGHLFSDKHVDFILEPSLSIFYEGGDYWRFRQENIPEAADYRASPISATLQFSQIVRYRFNDTWSATGVYSTGLPLDQVFSKYSFSGTLALTRGPLTAWTRPGLHLSVLSLTRPVDWTLGVGISHCLSSNYAVSK